MPTGNAASLSTADYAAALTSELVRLVDPGHRAPPDLAARLGPPAELARLVAELLPRRSPWADAVGSVYTSAQVARLLGCSRQAVADRVQRHTLLALHTSDGRLAYPTFQFDGRRVVDGLADVLAVVFGSGPRVGSSPDADGEPVDDWTLASWLTAPLPSLGQRSVMDVLRDQGPTEQVLAQTRAASARWAR